ncbi:MAG: GPI mannosyltransferase 1 [Chaenotheca gracillima]|nr:MAG: GPI mannosyltransferase 1 [Chaenotheca gracillima]
MAFVRMFSAGRSCARVARVELAPTSTSRFGSGSGFGAKEKMMATPGQPRAFSSYFVSPKELETALAKNAISKISTAPRTVPLCAAWFLPNDPQKRTGHAVFQEKRIPSARFFDLDAVKDNESPYPHMLPSAERFAQVMGELGVNPEDEIVVYDTAELGIFSAPRVGWTLKVFGHPKVHILNNFKLWVEEGYPTESGAVQEIRPTQYTVPKFDAAKVVDFAEVRDIARDYGKEGAEGVQILDARSAGRWAGTAPEPRPGLPSGHIPGSFSVPIDDMLDPDTKTLLPAEQLRQLFLERGVDPKKPVISSCGTGVTAAVIDAALNEAEHGDPETHRLYDGSWTEWAQRVTEADGLIKKAH